jgi:hypothetical protein
MKRSRSASIIKKVHSHLKEHLRVPHSVEEPLPPCHLRLPCAAYNNVQASIKVIQEFDRRRQ